MEEEEEEEEEERWTLYCSSCTSHCIKDCFNNCVEHEISELSSSCLWWGRRRRRSMRLSVIARSYLVLFTEAMNC